MLCLFIMIIHTYNIFACFIIHQKWSTLSANLLNSIHWIYFHAGITLYAAHPLVECSCACLSLWFIVLLLLSSALYTQYGSIRNGGIYSNVHSQCLCLLIYRGHFLNFQECFTLVFWISEKEGIFLIRVNDTNLISHGFIMSFQTIAIHDPLRNL